jgi:hypothetical protein
MIEHAPGAPGIPPTWTSSAEDMVGCALGSSRLWFTLGFGIVNEVYYPRVDIPQIRDLGLIVADGEGFWAEVKRVADYQLRLLAPGVPAVEIVHRHQRYSLLLRIRPGIAPRCSSNRVSARRRSKAAALCTSGAASGRHRLRQPCCNCLASRPTNRKSIALTGGRADGFRFA